MNPGDGAFRVITGDFVTTVDGTGIVHIAPTFGADDYRAGREHGIPPLMVMMSDGFMGPLVDRRGRMVPMEDLDQAFVATHVNTDTYGPFAGRYVKNEYDDTIPAGTETLALIMDDPDAPGGTWVHWLVWNIPGRVRRLEEGDPPRWRWRAATAGERPDTVGPAAVRDPPLHLPAVRPRHVPRAARDERSRGAREGDAGPRSRRDRDDGHLRGVSLWASW